MVSFNIFKGSQAHKIRTLFFERNIFSPIDRKCFNTYLHIFLFSIDLYWRVLVGLLMFSGAIIHLSPWSKLLFFEKVREID
jgi:hypothetical protein